MRFAANAEKHKDIRTKEQKCFKTYGHGLASMCPQEHKGYAVAFNAIAFLFMTLKVLTA